MSTLPELRMSVPEDHVDSTNQLNRIFREVNTWANSLPAQIETIVETQAAAQPPFPTTAAGSTALTSSGVEAGTGIAVSGGSSGAGSVMVSNTGVTSLTAQGFSPTTGAVAGGPVAQRVTTGSIALSSTAPVTLTWTNPFADANYTPVCSVVDSTGFLAIVDIASFSATQVVVNVKNNDAAAAHTGTLCAIALHD